jgi:pyoverdine/dityrosine biosynthesis protein Dit1
MGYLNNQVITVDAILTKKGRELLAKNDGSFRITQFALADDEIDYTLYNPTIHLGLHFMEKQLIICLYLEAFPLKTNNEI